MELTLLFLIPVVAFLYSSVGHGGASGYLALMAIFSVDPVLMRSSALILNLFVSSIAFFAFYKGGYFRWRILLPFVLTSMPLAYIGARMNIDPTIYKVILAICLLIGIARMLFAPKVSDNETRPLPFSAGLIVGAMLGFISGLIGIGGGIVLSPILLLFRWANVKETATISAMFIFLNSASGLTGVVSKGIEINTSLLLMVSMANLGGVFGSFSGSFRFRDLSIKYILSFVLLVACIKLLTT